MVLLKTEMNKVPLLVFIYYNVNLTMVNANTNSEN